MRALYEKLSVPYVAVVGNTPLRVLGYAHRHQANILFVGDTARKPSGLVDERVRIRSPPQHSGETIQRRDPILQRLRRNEHACEYGPTPRQKVHARKSRQSTGRQRLLESGACRRTVAATPIVEALIVRHHIYVHRPAMVGRHRTKFGSELAFRSGNEEGRRRRRCLCR